MVISAHSVSLCVGLEPYRGSVFFTSKMGVTSVPFLGW